MSKVECANHYSQSIVQLINVGDLKWCSKRDTWNSLCERNIGIEENKPSGITRGIGSRLCLQLQPSLALAFQIYFIDRNVKQLWPTLLI